jgi:signal transduction histidine kinase/Flp pilus assembly protein TadD
LNSYGKALAEKGDFQKAFEMFERSLQLNANDTIALNSYGKALAEKGDFQKAFEMFERSLQVDANDIIALNSYGYALADNGDFEKAFEMFERSLQVDANDIIALNSYGYALAANNDFQKAFEMFEKSLQIKPDDHITLFMYAIVLEAVQKYEEAISSIEKIRFADLSLDYMNFIGLKLGQLCYLTKKEANGKKYFDWVIKNAKQTDVGRLQAAKHILAIKPYSQEAIDLLKKIIETSPNHTQALKMLSLNLNPKEYFEMFKTSAKNSLKDTEMLNRAMHHKILNEISMLKAIAYQIVKDDRASEVLSKVIKSIETTYKKITQRWSEEKTKVEQMPTDNYEEIVAIISQTAHDIADIANNELAIIKRRLQRVLEKLNQKDRLFYKLEKLLQRIEITEMALNDLKSVNENIMLHYNIFKVKALFEPWQTTSTLEHATLSFDIQNGDSEFVGDKEKIKSFLSELMENALKHNPDQADLEIAISSKDIESASHTGKTLSKKILSANAKKSLLIIFRDNGKGIPPEKKEQIFLALETTSKEGSGLGLFIIKRTIEKMKGHIIETGTEGACFEIDIPYGEQ